jgi:uncharacterized protein (DUF2336 family)
MTPAAQSLLAELEAALKSAPEPWRRTALRQILDLFLSGAEVYNDDQVSVFDEVMVRLMQKADRTALAEVSSKLAAVANAPVKVSGKLARHADMAVSGPMLAQAKALPDTDLVEIADKDRVDMQLLRRIAARPELNEPVTDILLKRGDAAIKRQVIQNPNARVSESGFARLVIGLNGDKTLAGAIAARSDVPPELRVWLDAILKD